MKRSDRLLASCWLVTALTSFIIGCQTPQLIPSPVQSDLLKGARHQATIHPSAIQQITLTGRQDQTAVLPVTQDTLRLQHTITPQRTDEDGSYYKTALLIQLSDNQRPSEKAGRWFLEQTVYGEANPTRTGAVLASQKHYLTDAPQPGRPLTVVLNGEQRFPVHGSYMAYRLGFEPVEKVPQLTYWPPIMLCIPCTISYAKCLLQNGTERAYNCEFKIKKVILYGKDGSVLGEVTASQPTISLPYSQAKAKSNSAFDLSGYLTYSAKVVVIRRVAPAFTPQQGYMLKSYWYYNAHSDAVSGYIAYLPISPTLNQTTEIPVDLVYHYYPYPSPSIMGGQREIYLENDVTTNQPAIPQLYLRDKAEAWFKFDATLTP